MEKKNDSELLHEEIEKEIYDPFSKLNRKKKRNEMSEGPKYKDPLEYTPKEFIEFKKRLGFMISTDGISCDDCLANPDYKNYVSNYTEKHFIKDAVNNVLQRYTYRLDTLTLGRYIAALGITTQTQFPVVQQFKGHFLVKTIYFAKGLNGQIEIREVFVKEKPIIIK